MLEGCDLAERHALQVRVAGLTEEEREEESLIKPPPLARVARENVALFTAGDVLTARRSATRGAPLAFYALAPTRVVAVNQRTVAELAARHPAFEARFQRAMRIARERLAFITGVKTGILDFLCARASRSRARWSACATGISASTASCARRRARSATARAA